MLPAVIAFLLIYRYWKGEKDLSQLEWKVKAKDLKFNPPERKKGRSVLLTKSSHSKVATLKNTVVLVKTLRKQNIKESRALLMEMKMMKSFNHPNLATFIGCVTSPTVSVIWEFGSRGSITDLLENRNGGLPLRYFFSIALDICEGLSYLHKSNLGYHGRLRASNCVISGNWVTKLTDFGLDFVRKGEQPNPDQTDDEDYSGLFWTAPEVLRCFLSQEKATLTKMADIYSLGVILNQLVTGKSPFSESSSTLTPKEIVMKVAHAEPGKPFRPHLSPNNLNQDHPTEDRLAQEKSTEGNMICLNNGKDHQKTHGINGPSSEDTAFQENSTRDVTMQENIRKVHNKENVAQESSTKDYVTCVTRKRHYHKPQVYEKLRNETKGPSSEDSAFQENITRKDKIQENVHRPLSKENLAQECSTENYVASVNRTRQYHTPHAYEKPKDEKSGLSSQDTALQDSGARNHKAQTDSRDNTVNVTHQDVTLAELKDTRTCMKRNKIFQDCEQKMSVRSKDNHSALLTDEFTKHRSNTVSQKFNITDESTDNDMTHSNLAQELSSCDHAKQNAVAQSQTHGDILEHSVEGCRSHKNATNDTAIYFECNAHLAKQDQMTSNDCVGSLPHHINKIAQSYETFDSEPPEALQYHIADEYHVIMMTLSCLVCACWSEDATLRPKVKKVKKKLQRINPFQDRSILDAMVKLKERFSNDLEDVVSTKLASCNKGNRENSLSYAMLPFKVKDDLQAGQFTRPQIFEEVTVLSSGIIGFSELALDMSPLQMVELLDQLYRCFDKILLSHGAQKVESVNDSYLAVMGCPLPCSDHALKMADVARSLTEFIANFTIPHVSQRRLGISIGVSSGPVVACVVGARLPRFCLFGSTVMAAERLQCNTRQL